MDVMKHHAPEYPVQFLPTISLFPSGVDAPVLEYDGERTLESLSRFVEIAYGVKHPPKDSPVVGEAI